MNLPGGLHGCKSLCFSPDGKRLAFAERSYSAGKWVTGKVHIRDIRTGQELFAFDGYELGDYDVFYSSDGSRLAAHGIGNALVWDARTGQELLRVNEQRGMLVYADLSPDGKRLATLVGSFEVKLWDVPTSPSAPHAAQSTILTKRSWAGSVHFSPDGKRLVFGGEDGSSIKVNYID